MNLKELKQLKKTIMDLSDFFEENSDGEIIGLHKEYESLVQKAYVIIEKEQYKLHLRNALARCKRK